MAKTPETWIDRIFRLTNYAIYASGSAKQCLEVVQKRSVEVGDQKAFSARKTVLRKKLVAMREYADMAIEAIDTAGHGRVERPVDA